MLDRFAGAGQAGHGSGVIMGVLEPVRSAAGSVGLLLIEDTT